MSVSSPAAPSRKFPVPLSYFSMPLGLSALGLSWRYGAAKGFAPSWPAEALLAVAALLWLLLIAAYAVKVWRFRADFLADLQDLVQCCFLSMIPITLLLLAMALLPYARLPAMLAVMLGVGAQLAFAMYRAAGLWRGSHTLAATTPVVFANGRRCVCQHLGIRRAGIHGLCLAVFRNGGIFVTESGRGDFVATAG